MAKQLNDDFEATLLNTIKGDGEVKYFTPEEINRSAERYAQFAEESEMEDRLRKAQAMSESSRIYLTF
jgi:hypothetical protein